MCNTGRRTKLPTPKPSTEDLSLWNLMKRNIGKDLSKVSMPVVLNEPIGMLQRLCEELEYSELLDKAAETEDPYERMVLIAAFAVSAYGSSNVRAGHKPFNPLLGETYECVREDKGFKYISEQVCLLFFLMYDLNILSSFFKFCRSVIIHPSAYVTPRQSTLNSGRIFVSRPSSGANQWSFNHWV